MLAVLVGCSRAPQPSDTPATPTPAPPPTVEQPLPEGHDVFLSVDGTADDATEVARIVDLRLRDAELGSARVDPADPRVVQVRMPRTDLEALERAKQIATRRGTLEFRVVLRDSITKAELEKRQAEGKGYSSSDPTLVRVDHAHFDESPYLVEVPECVPGLVDDAARRDVVAANVFQESDLAKLDIVRHPPSDGFAVLFELAPERKEAFRAFSRRFLKRQLAIILDGKVHSAPVIQSELPGAGIIEGGGAGGYTRQEATDLSIVLRHGALPVPVSVRSVGSDAPEDD